MRSHAIIQLTSFQLWKLQHFFALIALHRVAFKNKLLLNDTDFVAVVVAIFDV